MATLSYSFVSVCGSGDHLTLNVSLNASPAQRFVYDADDVRQPLSALTDDQRAALALLILKVHFTGQTRAQIQSALQAGVTVTV